MSIDKLFNELMNEECISFEQLNGGVTNTSYSIQTPLHHYVLRMPGKGTNEYINRYWEINNIKKLSQFELSPKIYYANCESGIIITEYLENNIPMSKEDLYDTNRLNLICNSLAELHKSSFKFDNEFDLELTKNQYIKLLNEMNAKLPVEVEEKIDLCEQMVKMLFDTFPKELVPCHGDPKLNNFLLQNNKIWLIDLEYSGMVDKYFDLVNMVMTNNLNSEEEKMILKSYEKYSNEKINLKKYILYKISTDYLWIFWHLIKLNQNEMVEYNENSWRTRLNRALKNIELLEGM